MWNWTSRWLLGRSTCQWQWLSVRRWGQAWLLALTKALESLCVWRSIRLLLHSKRGPLGLARHFHLSLTFMMPLLLHTMLCLSLTFHQVVGLCRRHGLRSK